MRSYFSTTSLLVAVIFFLVFISSSSSSSSSSSFLVDAAPAVYDCNNHSGKIVITHRHFPDGLHITGTDNATTKGCDIKIASVETAFIHFTDNIRGADTEIWLTDVTFYEFANTGTPIIPNVGGFFSAIAFHGQISDMRAMIVTGCTWKTNSTYIIGQMGLSFVFFDGPISLSTVTNGLYFGKNSWLATLDELPPHASQPPYKFLFSFAYFNSQIVSQNTLITFSKNTYHFSSSLKQELVVDFIVFGPNAGVTSTPLVVADNKILYVLTNYLELDMHAVRFQSPLTMYYPQTPEQAMMSNYLLQMTKNEIEFDVLDLGALRNPKAKVVEFNGAVYYQLNQLTPVAGAAAIAMEQFIVTSNKVTYKAKCASTFFGFLSFLSPTQLVSVNLTDNHFDLDINANYESWAYAIFVNDQIVPAKTSPFTPEQFGGTSGAINITGNSWHHHLYASRQSNQFVYSYFLQLPLKLPSDYNNTSAVELSYVIFHKNFFDAELNTTKVGTNPQGTSASQSGSVYAGLMLVQDPETGKPVKIGNVDICDTIAWIFTMANEANFFLVLSQAKLETYEKFTLHNNEITARFPGAKFALSLFSALQDVIVAPLLVEDNKVYAFRYACPAALVPCANDVGTVGRYAGVTLVSINARYTILHDSLFILNYMQVGTNAMLPENEDVARQGVQVFSSYGTRLEIYKGSYLSFVENEIKFQLLAPSKSPPSPQRTLDRVAVAIAALLSWREAESSLIVGDAIAFSGNVVRGECAPCSVAQLIYNATANKRLDQEEEQQQEYKNTKNNKNKNFGDHKPTSMATGILEVGRIWITSGSVLASPPEQLHSHLYVDYTETANFVVAAQMMLCLPFSDQSDYQCRSKVNTRGNVSLFIRDTLTRFIFPSSWNINKDYTGPFTAKFPLSFSDVSFPISLVTVMSDSFAGSVAAGSTFGFAYNTFGWGDVPVNSTNYYKYISKQLISTVFTPGLPMFISPDAEIELDLNDLPILVGDYNLLGSGPSSSYSANNDCNNVGVLLDQLDMDWIAACDPLNPHHKKHKKHHGLSPGAAAAIIVVLLFAVALGGIFAYVKRDQISEWWNKKSSNSNYNEGGRLTEGDLTQFDDGRDYGTRESQMSAVELEERRRMSSVGGGAAAGDGAVYERRITSQTTLSSASNSEARL